LSKSDQIYPLAFRPFILYTETSMLLTPAAMRAFLVVCVLGMALLAAFFLRKRQLTLLEYIGWGLVIVLLPLLGPFLVILRRPGKDTH